MSPEQTAHWADLMQALGFAEKSFAQWHERQDITTPHHRPIADSYHEQRQNWTRAASTGSAPPDNVGLPSKERLGPEPSLQKQARWMMFVSHEVRRHQEAGRLSLAEAHALLAELRERVATVMRRIEQETVLDALPADEPAAAAPRSPARRSLLELILDPRNIQWLLVFGGVMLVGGLVLYLYTVGVFENKIVVAGLMGAGTLGLLVGGWAVIRYTAFQMAGRAMTLLACLIMPLNLWFYHAQELHPFTLHELLWVPALVCCGLYAASALVLRQRMFVYVLVAGVTLSSMLILANVDGPEQFWQITHPAILLSVLGLVTLHLERAFPEGEGEFTRKRFGLAFFWSGHVVFALGLLLVLLAQVYGVVYQIEPGLIRWIGWPTPAPITHDVPLKLLALLIVLAGTYVYLYSDLIVRRVGGYLYAAVFTLLWAELLAIDLLRVTLTVELVILVMAATALLVNLLQAFLLRAATEGQPNFWSRAGHPLGLLLSVPPVLLGVGLHLRWLLFRQPTDTFELGWSYVSVMAVTAFACRLAAFLHRHSLPAVAAVYLFGAGAAVVVGLAGLLNVLGITTWAGQAPLLMVVPTLYLLAARWQRGSPSETPLVWVGHAATAIILASSLVTLQGDASALMLKQGVLLNLSLAAVFAEATLFYALAAGFSGRKVPIYLATFMACASVWQVLSWFQATEALYTLTFAAVGTLLLLAYRFAVLERFQATRLASTAFHCGNALLVLSFTAGSLITLTHLAAGHSDAQGSLLGMLVGLIVASVLAIVLVREAGWRRAYVVAALAQTALSVLVLAVFSGLTAWQKLEIVSVVLGLALLLVGHIGWYREGERTNDLVSFSLLLGSGLVTIALSVGVIVWRHANQFHWPDELSLLLAGCVLFLTGITFRLRSTTLGGMFALAVYVTTLLIYLPWTQMSMAAICLMVGGAGIFGVGLLLSLYRDRLLALPEQIKKRQGLFRVLSWR